MLPATSRITRQRFPSFFGSIPNEFTSALNSPITVFKIEFDEKGNPKRYQIAKRIFPFHEGFTIKELDGVIQAVVSNRCLGSDFLSSILGVEIIESQIREELRKPPPETMYGQSWPYLPCLLILSYDIAFIQFLFLAWL